MSRTVRYGERRIRVHGVRREKPDLRRLARALIDLAEAQVEAEAQAANEMKPSPANQAAVPRNASDRLERKAA